MNIIKEKENDTLSLMDKIEQKEVLEELKDYYLEYRDSLYFDDRITFGFEIEFENMDFNAVNKNFERTLPKGWHVKNDDTLNNGGEITTNILTDNPATWHSLKTICERVRDFAKVGVNTGSHIHIGTQALGDDPSSWLNFMKLWSVYENIIYRFCYGEYLNARPNIEEVAFPMADLFWEYAKKFKNEDNCLGIVRRIILPRNVGVNFKNVHDGTKEKKGNTIEFRCPNGTLNEVVWQNNLNLLIHLINYARSNNFDEYKIERRKYINRNIIYNIDYYNNIDIDMAFELSDMIFDNNVDKLYFLKQYFKSFQVCNNNKLYEKAKIFTK